MQVTHLEAVSLAQLPESPCYLLRFEATRGLQWVANAKREWQLTDGRPAIDAIAQAAGVSGAHVFRLKKAPAMLPGNKAMARLVKIAAKAHAVPRETAHAQIFWFFDPDSPRDVERLRTYLRAAEDIEAIAA